MNSLILILNTFIGLGNVSALGRQNKCVGIQNKSDLFFAKPTQCRMLKKDFIDWQLSYSKLLCLPLDEIKENYVRSNVKNAVFSEVLPTPLKKEPLKLVAYSEDVLVNILDMDPEMVDNKEFIEFIAGNKILTNSRPLAHRYGGHQFGTWAMQLGDGRALYIGDYMNRDGLRWELQLKGSGKTPYSREGDGRAVLRSTIREFLCSEAMHYLGIPTSRAAAMVVGNDLVQRDQFYNGFPQFERAAVLLRIAPSWFRFGSFELLAKTNDIVTLKKLTDFIMEEHFPEIDPRDPNKYVAFFEIVADMTLDLIAKWYNVGFTHGVLNTDNMSILGISIDYGPFGFVETYDPFFISNSSDKEGRYCLERQCEIVVWNLEKLAESLYPLMDDKLKAQMVKLLSTLGMRCNFKIRREFVKKLGFDADNDDGQLIPLFMKMLEDTGSDFTMAFRQLGEIAISDMSNPAKLKDLWALKMISEHESYPEFVKLYAEMVKREKGLTEEKRQNKMRKVNPRYILRNWMAQKAIEKAENDDFSEVKAVLDILKDPFTFQEEAELKGFAQPKPKWAYYIKVSCSS